MCEKRHHRMWRIFTVNMIICFRQVGGGEGLERGGVRLTQSYFAWHWRFKEAQRFSWKIRQNLAAEIKSIPLPRLLIVSSFLSRTQWTDNKLITKVLWMKVKLGEVRPSFSFSLHDSAVILVVSKSKYKVWSLIPCQVLQVLIQLTLFVSVACSITDRNTAIQDNLLYNTLLSNFHYISLL